MTAVSALLGDVPEGVVLDAIGVGFAAWALLVAAFVFMAYALGPVVERRIETLTRRLVGSQRPEGILSDGEASLGTTVDVLRPVASQLAEYQRERQADREHIAALYQTSPHPILLCSIDGEAIEANPAFYALSGLMPDRVRGARIETLGASFPVERLESFAVRSLSEGSSISGLESVLEDRDGNRRPVEISLRAFRGNGKALVLYQATDKAHERRLEQQVASFSDTLDLMVDQRVRQLTSGRQALGDLLNDADVALASFGPAGVTVRWNRAMERLTAWSRSEVTDFATAVDALALDDDRAMAFARWFWSGSTEPFITSHVGYRKRILWRRAESPEPGATDRRALIGVPLPLPRPVEPGGDGLAVSFDL
ncbi:MAG: PAS domain-containing protein [Bacteroidota bacterium]